MAKPGPKPQPPRFCSIDGCNKLHCAKGLCNTHYARQRKYGDVNHTKRFHRLSNIDIKLMKATCDLCGNVDIRARKGSYECMERVRAHSKRYRENNGTKRLKSKDGSWIKVNESEMFTLWVKQKGKCQGCQRSLSDLPRRHRHVDHCHNSKKVRGILCMNCNAILGHADDNIKTLKNLIEYLGG